MPVMQVLIFLGGGCVGCAWTCVLLHRRYSSRGEEGETIRKERERVAESVTNKPLIEDEVNNDLVVPSVL